MIKWLSKWRSSGHKQRGMILFSIFIVMVTLTIVALSVAGFAALQYTDATKDTYTADALYTAEAGIEQSMYQLNQNDNFGGYATEQQFFSNSTQGRGTYTVTIVNGTDSNAKTLTSTGKVYRAGTNTVLSQRIVKVTAVGTTAQGYSVQTGPGGLILGGSANITSSDVFVNGTLTLSGASKIGTPSQPLNVNVANDVCPTTGGSTYPQVCSGTQPINMAYSTAIYGSVCATGQTSKGPNNNIQGGNGGTGLQVGCVAAPVNTPTYDRAGQISQVTTTGSGSSNTYVCNSWPFDRTWPANLELTGNVSIASSCNLTVKGNVYITGNLSIGGASRITVDNSVGTTRPVIIVDGTITVNGSAQMVANSSGTGIEFISFKSNASCGSTCTSLSGDALKNTQGLQTISVGGAVSLPGMIFDAYWGKVTIGGSVSIGSAIGQTVDMSGAGTVTFGTTLSSGVRTWIMTSYQQVFH